MTDHDASTPTQRPALEQEKGAWAQHELLANYLRDGILSGDYPPGSKLPSTRVLKERFGVAPQTIKNANDMLAEEGLAYSQRGSGIIVRPHRQRTVVPAATKSPAAPGEAYPWLTEAGKTGSAGSSTLLEVAEVEPPADVAEALGIAKPQRAVRRSQILSIGDEPAEYVQCYYPVELARGTQLVEKRKIKGGTPRLLTDLGYPPLRCVDRLASRLPTPEQAKALALPGKLPVLRTLRVVYSQDDRVVEVTVMVKAGHLYEVQYEF
jgi:GntR family transcriptional regulator